MIRKTLTSLVFLIPTINADASPLTSSEDQITTLLNCAVIIARTEGGITYYEDYVVAASYLAADNDLSIEWLQGEIQRAAETAFDFAGEEGAAEHCVHTLRSAEDLLR
jgi:hypothetical protein